MLARYFNIPSKVYLLVHREINRPLTPQVGYLALYVVQLKVGLCFPFLSTNLLLFYDVPFSQLVPNAVMTMLTFERHCRDWWVTSIVSLFRAYFSFKTSTIVGWYYFSPQKKGFKVNLPNKNTE